MNAGTAQISLVARAVHESVSMLLSPDMTDEVIRTALDRAGLASIPDQAGGLADWVRGPLQNELVRVAGSDAADLVVEQLGNVVTLSGAKPLPIRKVEPARSVQRASTSELLDLTPRKGSPLNTETHPHSALIPAAAPAASGAPPAITAALVDEEEPVDLALTPRMGAQAAPSEELLDLELTPALGTAAAPVSDLLDLDRTPLRGVPGKPSDPTATEPCSPRTPKPGSAWVQPGLGQGDLPGTKARDEASPEALSPSDGACPAQAAEQEGPVTELRRKPCEQPIESPGSAPGETSRPPAGPIVDDTAVHLLKPRPVLLATRSRERAQSIARRIPETGKVSQIRSLADLLEALEGGARKSPLIVLDCPCPSLSPSSLLALAQDMPTGSTVVLWGADTDTWEQTQTEDRAGVRWVRCSPEAAAEDVGSMCVMLIN